METPEVRYAKSGDLSIAYMTAGTGPPDIVYVPNWTSNVEIFWEGNPFGRLLRRLSTMGRVIFFDQPGTGLSDPVPPDSLPTMEQWMDDVRIVMDAVGSRSAVFVAGDAAGPLAMLFAASHPERVDSLILTNSYARVLRDADYSWGFPLERRADAIDWWMERWGTGRQLELTSPNAAKDPLEVRAMGRAERHSASPAMARAIFNLISDLDVRHVLSAVRVPTLVVHTEKSRWIRVEHGRYLAEHIPGAEFVGLDGNDTGIFYGDLDPYFAEVERFLAHAGTSSREPERALFTIMFTDIVDSSARAGQLGDARWKELLDAHDAMVRLQLDRFRGREIKTTGDGFLATFDGPARAVQCARALRDAAHALGISVRAGLHTGECELRGEDIGGIAVHIAARVASAAGGGEVLVSSTVRDLVAGSRLVFQDRGLHELKGVGEWRLFSMGV